MSRGLSWSHNTAQSTFFNTSLSWLHLLNQWQFWQPPKLFLLFLRTVPNSLGPSCCSSLSSLQQEVLLCFSQSTAQGGSTGVEAQGYLVAAASSPAARSHSARWAPSKCSDGAGSSTHSTENRQVWKCYVWDREKMHFGLLPQCNN